MPPQTLEIISSLESNNKNAEVNLFEMCSLGDSEKFVKSCMSTKKYSELETAEKKVLCLCKISCVCRIIFITVLIHIECT